MVEIKEEKTQMRICVGLPISRLFCQSGIPLVGVGYDYSDVAFPSYCLQVTKVYQNQADN